MRLWRSTFMRGGVEALRTCLPPGPTPVKADMALAVAEQILAEPVANRPNWTPARLSPARLSVVLRQRGRSAGADLATA